MDTEQTESQHSTIATDNEIEEKPKEKPVELSHFVSSSIKRLELRRRELLQGQENVKEMQAVFDRHCYRTVHHLQQVLKESLKNIKKTSEVKFKQKLNELSAAQSVISDKVSELKELEKSLQVSGEGESPEQVKVPQIKEEDLADLCLCMPSMQLQPEISCQSALDVLQTLTLEFTNADKLHDLPMDLATPALEGCEKTIYVSSRIGKQGTFWGVVAPEENVLSALNHMSLCIREKYVKDISWQTCEERGAKPAVGDFVYAQFPVDKKWYRASVVDTDSLITVLYLDYGNTHTVKLDQMILPDEDIFKSCAYQAFECTVFETVPETLPLTPRFTFNEMVMAAEVSAKFVRQIEWADEKCVWYTELTVYDRKGSGRNVNEEVLKAVDEEKRGQSAISCRDVRLMENPSLQVREVIEKPREDNAADKDATMKVSTEMSSAENPVPLSESSVDTGIDIPADESEIGQNGTPDASIQSGEPESKELTTQELCIVPAELPDLGAVGPSTEDLIQCVGPSTKDPVQSQGASLDSVVVSASPDITDDTKTVCYDINTNDSILSKSHTDPQRVPSTSDTQTCSVSQVPEYVTPAEPMADASDALCINSGQVCLPLQPNPEHQHQQQHQDSVDKSPSEWLATAEVPKKEEIETETDVQLMWRGDPDGEHSNGQESSHPSLEGMYRRKASTSSDSSERIAGSFFSGDDGTGSGDWQTGSAGKKRKKKSRKSRERYQETVPGHDVKQGDKQETSTAPTEPVSDGDASSRRHPEGPIKVRIAGAMDNKGEFPVQCVLSDEDNVAFTQFGQFIQTFGHLCSEEWYEGCGADLVLVSENSEWKRARIHEVLGNKKRVSVRYVDLGKSATVPVANVKIMVGKVLENSRATEERVDLAKEPKVVQLIDETDLKNPIDIGLRICGMSEATGTFGSVNAEVDSYMPPDLEPPPKSTPELVAEAHSDFPSVSQWTEPSADHQGLPSRQGTHNREKRKRPPGYKNEPSLELMDAKLVWSNGSANSPQPSEGRDRSEVKCYRQCPQGSQVLQCFLCHQVGHISRQCPQNSQDNRDLSGIQCFNCNGYGHYKSQCSMPLDPQKKYERGGRDRRQNHHGKGGHSGPWPRRHDGHPRLWNPPSEKSEEMGAKHLQQS